MDAGMAMATFTRAFDLSIKVHGTEENGACVIALQNIAETWNSIGNLKKCSEVLGKCLALEKKMNGKNSLFYTQNQ